MSSIGQSSILLQIEMSLKLLIDTFRTDIHGAQSMNLNDFG